MIIWVTFWINIITIAVSFKKRMLLYALANAIFLFLVTGQAFQIETDLARAHTVYYLYNFISDSGFDLATWYVLGISCVALALAVVSRGYRKNSDLGPTYTFAPSRLFYVSLFLFLCFFSIVLIFFVVGLSEFLNSSRPGFQTGSTIFLVLLSLGLMPLLFKIIYRGQIGAGDIACFLVAFIMTGTMGRLSAGFYLLMILLAVYYERGWADAPLTPRLLAKIFGFGFAAVALFIAYGAIRGAQAFASGSLWDLLDFLQEHPEKSVLSLEWNYRFDIEGMSGISGAFTQYLNHPNLVHFDYGASWLLRGTIQWFPGVLKPYLDSIRTLSADLNWYPYSIVATGVESFFVSFGWFAVLLFPAIVYLLTWRLPLFFLRVQFSPVARYAAYVIMTWTVIFVRGPLDAWMAFCFSYAMVPLLFWPMFWPHFKKEVSGSLESSRIAGKLQYFREPI